MALVVYFILQNAYDVSGFENDARFIQRSGDNITLPNRERLFKLGKFQNGRLRRRSSQPCVGGN